MAAPCVAILVVAMATILKGNDAWIIGLFLVSKRNEPTFSRTWKDQNKANTISNILCRIEEIKNINSPEFAGSKRKRI
jgi:hypothetical protein